MAVQFLQSYKPCESSNCSKFTPILLIVNLLNFSLSSGCEIVPHVVLICTLVIYISSFVKRMFKSLAHFFWVDFLQLSCKSSSYSQDLSFTQSFARYMYWGCFLLMVSFEKQKDFIFMKADLSIFFFSYLVLCPTKSLLMSKSWFCFLLEVL